MTNIRYDTGIPLIAKQHSIAPLNASGRGKVLKISIFCKISNNVCKTIVKPIVEGPGAP